MNYRSYLEIRSVTCQSRELLSDIYERVICTDYSKEILNLGI